MTTFRQVVSKIQDGLQEEAKVGLEFVLRLDPTFSPGLELQRQLTEERPTIDLTALISHLDAPSTDTINILLVEAVEEFNQRNYLEAKEKVGKVLLDLPGHAEARNLLGQVDEALKVENQVGLFLTQAREALDRGDPEEGANFVMMAQALDPHHRGIKAMLVALQSSGATEKPQTQASPRPSTQDIPASAPAPPQGGAPQQAPETPAPKPPQPTELARGGDGLAGGEHVADSDSWSIANAFDVDSTGGGEPKSPVEPPVSAALPGDSDISDLFAVESDEFVVDTGASQRSVSNDAEPSFDSGDFVVDTGGFAVEGDGFAAESDDFAVESDDFKVDPGALPVDAGDFRVDAGDFPEDAGDDPAQKADEDSFAFADAPQPPQNPPPDPAQPSPPLERSGPDFDDSSEDLGDLFQSDPEIGDPFDPTAGPAPSTDPVDSRAEQVQALIDDANTAWQDGNLSRSRDIVEGILSTEPGHIEALDLISRIEAATEPVVPESPPVEIPTPEDLPPETPRRDDGDSDLFAQEFELPEDVVAISGDESPVVAEKSTHTPARRSTSGFPWRLVNLIGAGIAIVVVTMWLGRGFFSGNGDTEEERAQVVTRRLQEADTLFNQGKTEEALHLLQTFQAEGIEQQRIDKRIARYEKDLAPPPPTPIPQAFTNGRDLIDQGRWLDAYWEIDGGLHDHPEDPGLRALLNEVAEIEPEVVSLQASLQKKDFATATSIVADLEIKYPGQPGFVAIHDRSLFNAALSALRSYNLAGARNHLQRLGQRQPQDTDVIRILDFISSYMNRPVDMQLEIFVGSLENR